MQTIVFSPLSICSVLGMAALGAAGETATQLFSFLGTKEFHAISDGVSIDKPSEYIELKMINSLYFDESVGQHDVFPSLPG